MAGALTMLRSPRDFAAMEGVRGRSTPLLSVRARRNGLAHPRFGIATGRKVGGSVVRNRIRRRLRAILRTWDRGGQPGWDILIVARPASAAASYADLRAALLSLLAPLATREGTTTR